jgi:hypothetical protein
LGIEVPRTEVFSALWPPFQLVTPLVVFAAALFLFACGVFCLALAGRRRILQKERRENRRSALYLFIPAVLVFIFFGIMHPTAPYFREGLSLARDVSFLALFVVSFATGVVISIRAMSSFVIVAVFGVAAAAGIALGVFSRSLETPSLDLALAAFSHWWDRVRTPETLVGIVLLSMGIAVWVKQAKDRDTWRRYRHYG